MAIDIRFFTAVFTKAGIDAGYPGGLEGFRNDHPHAKEDKHLLALVAMSGGEINDLVDAIGAKGVDVDACCAVADMAYGPLRSCEAIRIYSTHYQNLDPVWVAEAVSEEARRKAARAKLDTLLSGGYGPLPMTD